MRKQYNIGDKAYPRDNSWMVDAETKSSEHLAATQWSEPELVTIVSLPYRMLPVDKYFPSTNEHEFVTVLWRGRCYIPDAIGVCKF